MVLRVQFLKKRKFRMQNLGKEWKQPPGVILQQKNFYNIFILCLWLRIIRRSDQGVQFMNFPSQIFFLIPFYMTVASYCYYENVRRTMRTTIASYFLNCFYSWIILSVKTKFLLRNFHMKGVTMKIAMNECISGRLSGNYFPLNESSSLY